MVNVMKKDTRNTTSFVIFSIIILFLIAMILYTIFSNKIDIYSNIEDNYTKSTPTPPSTSNKKEENKLDKNEEENKNPPEHKEKQIVEEDITSYTTEILDRKGTRIHNIKLAVEKLTDASVAPGETFSFNSRVGKMGKEQGYEKAESFKTDGTKFLEYGGGICQVSSTLYNTVLDSGLEVVERHPHSRRVYYVPKNRDATIYYGHKDFKFKNTLENTIKIYAEASDTNLTIRLVKLVEK